METVVVVLMILVCFNFMLKQTYRKWGSVTLIAVVCALFVGLIWPYAIEHSKTQIADWLSVLQMAFCMLAAHVMTTGRIRKRTLWSYKALRWFPGLLIFPVLFSGLVALIFSFPGVSFPRIAWSMAAGVLVLIPAGTFVLQRLLPEKELRLELLFLANALIAVLGVITTVNGRTAVTGNTVIDWSALAGLTALTLVGTIGGFFIARIKRYYKLRKNKEI